MSATGMPLSLLSNLSISPVLAMIDSLYFIAIALICAVSIFSASALTSPIDLFSSAFEPHPASSSEHNANKVQIVIPFIVFIFGSFQKCPLKQDHHDGDYQKNVNETAHGVGSEHP